MSNLDEIFQSLPISQIAAQVGASEQDVQQASAAILPALLGGLQANAADPSGAASIEEALQQHSPALLDGGVDVSQIDTADGQKIASHIFGANEDQVVNQLGGIGGPGLDSPLVRKLIPILAPIVMAWLAKQVFGGVTNGQQQASGGGILGNILGSVLGGGGLGGMLGGGQSQQAQPQQTQAQPQVEQQQAPQMPAQPTQQQAPQQSSGGIDDIINSAINAGGGTPGASGGAAPGQQQQQSGGVGSILGDVLGGLLGGGRR